MATRILDPDRHHCWHAMQIISADHGHFLPRTVARLVMLKHPRVLTEWLVFLGREDVVRAKGDGRHSVVAPGETPPAGRPLAQSFGVTQAAIWRAMRLTRAFSIDELVRDASTDEMQVKREYARTYVTALTRAGILRGGNALSNGVPGWRLLPNGDTGPRAPVIVDGGVHDLNLGRRIFNLDTPGLDVLAAKPRRAA